MQSSLFVRQFLRTAPGYDNKLAQARDRLAERESRPIGMLDAAKDQPRAESRRLSSGVCLIDMPPELHGPDEKPYVDASSQLAEPGPNYLMLNFSRVMSINGLGATMLVKLGALTGARRQKILAFGISDHHRRVFDLTGLSRAVRVCADFKEACSLSGLSSSELASGGEPANPVDVESWARLPGRLVVPPMPPDAIDMNMRGRAVVGPVDGFGALWQKTYRLPVVGMDISPEDVVRVLKHDFPLLQPRYNRFYPGPKGIAPGEAVAIDSSTPGGPVSTGVMVLFADDRSFTFITPQGHPESGWVTFSAFRSASAVVVQIVGLARANDPVYEAAFRAVGSAMQIRIWRHVLTSLANYLGIPGDVTVQALCVDPRVRWSQAGNVWYNAQARTLLAAPVWLGRRLLRGSSKR
jgi:anti-anti-sigma regulatory factor